MGGGGQTPHPPQKKRALRVKTNNDLLYCSKFLMVLKYVNPTILWGGGGEGQLAPTSLRIKPIFKPKIDQADHFRPKSCF